MTKPRWGEKRSGNWYQQMIVIRDACTSQRVADVAALGDQCMSSRLLRLLFTTLKVRHDRQKSLLKIISNAGWLWADNVVRLGLGVIIGIWLARNLGASDFGIYKYVLAFVGLFSAAASLGIDNVLMRELINNQHRTRELLGTAFLLKFIGGIVAWLVAVGAIVVVRPNDTYILILVAAAATSLVFQASNVVNTRYQSLQQNQYGALLRISITLSSALIKVAMLLQGVPLLAFISLIAIEAFFTAAGYLFMYRRQQGSLRWDITKKSTKSLLSKSWPFFFTGIAIAIYMRIDIVMLGSILSDKESGIYAAASQLSEVWYFIPSAIVVASSPILLRVYRGSQERFMLHLTRLLTYVIWAAIFISLLFTFASDFFVVLIYGASFSAAGAVLAVHIWSAVFVFIGLAVNVWIIANGYSKYALFQTSLGACLNIILNYILIHRYGPEGAAWATLISYGFVTYILNGLFPFSRPVFFITTRAFLGNIYGKRREGV